MGLLRWLRGGRIARLPAVGTAYVVSDLHGHLLDFRSILDDCGFVGRCEAGEPVHMVLLGDAGDLERHRWVDGRVSQGDDARLFDLLIELKKRFPANLHYVEGNHDFHLLRIFRELEQFQRERGLSGFPSNAVITAYFDSFVEAYGEGCFRVNIEPYDFVWRARPHHLDFVRSSSLVALGANGLLCVHAGPPRRSAARVRRFLLDREARDSCLALEPEQMMATTYYQLLNNRYPNDYGVDDLDAFLTALGGRVMISGHSPLPQFADHAGAPMEGCAVRDGVVAIGGRQGILGSSYGSLPDAKRYLAIDLARTYNSIDEFEPGREILAVPTVARPSILDEDSADVDVPDMIEVFDVPPAPPES